jgi:hypothetical protein
MPRRLWRLRPAARAKPVSSSGVTNCSPAVRSGLEPAQHIFGADDRKRKAPQCAVESRGEQKAARLDQRGGGGDEAFRIGGVLDHLHRAHDIDKPRLLRQLLDRAHAISELGARLLGMMACGLDRGGGLSGINDPLLSQGSGGSVSCFQLARPETIRTRRSVVRRLGFRAWPSRRSPLAKCA